VTAAETVTDAVDAEAEVPTAAIARADPPAAPEGTATPHSRKVKGAPADSRATAVAANKAVAVASADAIAEVGGVIAEVRVQRVSRAAVIFDPSPVSGPRTALDFEPPLLGLG
jgi:hypothetical protein